MVKVERDFYAVGEAVDLTLQAVFDRLVHNFPGTFVTIDKRGVMEIYGPDEMASAYNRMLSREKGARQSILADLVDAKRSRQLSPQDWADLVNLAVPHPLHDSFLY